MKFFNILFLFAIALNASDKLPITIENLKGDFLYEIDRNYLPKGFTTSNEEIKKKIDKDIVFATLYLKTLNQEETNELKYNILTYLSKQSKNKILNKRLHEITKDIAYSYYIAHKKEFYFNKSIDLYIYNFSKESEAKKFKIGDKLPKDANQEIYRDVKYKELYPNYLMQVDNLKPNEISDVNIYKNKYIKFYYKINKPDGLLSFEDSYPFIQRVLLSQKSNNILSDIYKKEKNNEK